MLCKLVWGNVLRAKRDYLVYLLTLVLAVTVFYAFNTIAVQVDLAGVAQEGLKELLGSMISGLTLFLGLVMGFLMVYANGYIMKRRKKEFGLYQVLGMSGRQVSFVMALETLLVSVTALVIGTICGVLLSQLMVFFTASLFKTQIADFHFFFSLSAFLTTTGCLVAIFLVTLVFNLRVVSRARIADLMDADRKNEAVKVRNPWLSAAIFVLGAALIGVAYYRLIRDGIPIDGDPAAMQGFGITTLTVVVGTVLFFFGMSGFLLKVLQVVRGVYWRGLNMVTLRQLSAKVNTVSLSMAVIAMILFLAITSVVTGMSIAGVMTNNIENLNPADYSRVMVYYSPAMVADWNATDTDSGTHYAAATQPLDMVKTSSNDVVNAGLSDAHAFDITSIIGSSVQVNVYDSRSSATNKPYLTLIDLCEMSHMEIPAGIVSDAEKASQQVSMAVMSESDYNAYLRFRGMDEIDLGDDGYVITSDMGPSVNDIYNAVMGQHLNIDLGGHVLKPVRDKVDEKASSFTNSTMGSNSGTIVVPDAVIEGLDMPLYNSYLLADYADGVSVEEGDDAIMAPRTYAPVCNENGDTIGSWGMEATRTTSIESSNNMNGLISYLAIYIGFVLVVACASILTIQQLSSVADASKNYRILAELGTSERQISRSVLVQQLVFFVFPLVVGFAHSLVALDVVIELVALFSGLSISATAGFTTLIFLLAYGSYFALCFFMSKRIVHEAVRTRHA